MSDVLALAQQLRDENAKIKRLERIEALQDRVYDHAVGIIEATLSFHEVSPDQKDPPPEWVEAYGEKAARQRLAVAKAGWMPASLAPAGVKTAIQAATGIDRARHTKAARISARELNVQLQLPPPVSQHEPLRPPEYPSKRIE